MSKDLNERTNAENEKNAAGTGNAGKEKYEVRGREIVGRTHAAHETRHLARKMKAVREGKVSEKEISDLSKKSQRKEKALSKSMRIAVHFWEYSRLLSSRIHRMLP